MECQILFAVMLISAKQTINGDWIATNSSLFCMAANGCIVMNAESPWTPDDRPDGEDAHDGNATKACYDHRGVCKLSPNLYHRHPIDEKATFYMNSDRKTFCRIIMKCYEGKLITGPTVDAPKLCPYSQFCDQSPSSDIGEWGSSCCLSCSCKPSCRLNNNCCYNSDFTDENAADSAKWKCLTFQIQNSFPIGLYIKDTCSNGSKCHYDRYIPTISQTKQHIYVDEDCGHCNDADDVTIWEADLQCRGGGQYDCDTIFALPDRTTFRWMEQYMCSSKAIRTCDPRYRNEAVKKACHETNAMVLAGSQAFPIIFANIFCLACNYYLDYSPQETCQILGTASFPPTEAALNMLLDTNTQRNAIQKATAGYGHGGNCAAYTLRNIQQPGCRTIFCPDGMVRVNDGSCQYIGKIWYRVTASMQVSLHPMHETTVPASLLTSISSRYDIRKWMHSPCLPLNNAHDVYMLSSADALVDEIVIRIVPNAVNIVRTPKEYISNWAKCFDDPWYLTLDGNFNMSAFSPLFYTYKNGELPNTYTRIYHAGTNPFGFPAKVNVILTKLFFCNQVELPSGEFEHYQETDRIRLLHNNVTLGNNSFNRIDDYVRVCVQDYLYSDISNISADSTVPVCSRALLMNVLVIALLLQC